MTSITLFNPTSIASFGGIESRVNMEIWMMADQISNFPASEPAKSIAPEVKPEVLEPKKIIPVLKVVPQPEKVKRN